MSETLLDAAGLSRRVGAIGAHAVALAEPLRFAPDHGRVLLRRLLLTASMTNRSNAITRCRRVTYVSTYYYSQM